MRNRRIFLLIIFITILITGCGNKTSTINYKISTYIWDAGENIKNENLVKNLNELNVSTAYINAGYEKIFKDNILRPNRFYLYSKLINNASINGISIEALYGEPSWSLRENYDSLIGQVSDVFKYNLKNPNNKFTAIHLDIEPYQLEGWDKNKKKYLQEYLDNLKQLKEEIFIHNKKYTDNLTLVVDLPSWISNKNNDGSSFKNELLNIVNGINLMTYTQNSKSFIDWAEPWLESGEKANIDITVTLELQEKYSDITLFDFSKNEFDKYLSDAYKIFKNYKSFNGFAFHEYNSHIKYLNK